MKNAGGDVLARGGTRCTFRPAEGVTQEAWDKMFEDFDAEKYRSNTDSEEARDAGALPRKVKSRPSGPVA